MLLSSTVILATSCFAQLAIGASNLQAKVSTPTAFKSASANSVTSNVLTLSKKASSKGYNPRSAAWLMGKHGTIPTGKSTTLTSLFMGQEFVATVTFGATTFEAIVDTGSSDTWLAETGFECVDVNTRAAVPEATCDFGPTYNVSDTFKQIANENFNTTYGDGEFVTGIMGTEDVTLAGIKVNQQVGLANLTGWVGDGATSGILGLAYPEITNAYAGTDPTLDNGAGGEQIIYNPIFTTMYQSGLIPPLFSLALLRDVSGVAGYLALGGVPPVDFVQDFTSTPLLITSIEGFVKAYDFYTINIDGVALGGQIVNGSGGDVQYIVDSGTTLNYFPTSVADAVNAAFDPPAVYSADEGAYIVNCTAKAPSVGIQISGKIFYINPLDLIFPGGTDANGNDVCVSSIDDGGDDQTSDIYILGNLFQKNVVSVFDVGAAELRFAAREFYADNGSVQA